MGQSIISSKEELVLLSLHGKELYGLQIPIAVKESSNSTAMMAVGTLYPALHSLEKKGFIESRWGEPTTSRGGARRRYYKLTGSGKAAIDSIQTFRLSLCLWQPV